MTPGELRSANVERFKLLLEEIADPELRLRIEQLLGEERLKPDGAYPASASRSRDSHGGTDLRTFSCFTYDNLSAGPAESQIVADGETHARSLVRSQLLKTPNARWVEVFEGGKLLWRETP